MPTRIVVSLRAQSKPHQHGDGTHALASGWQAQFSADPHFLDRLRQRSHQFAGERCLQLTIRAAPSCGSDIQENAATRTFQANLQQRGSAISLTITSPTTVTDTTIGPFGGVGPARLDFYLQKMPDDTPPRFVLLDRLSTNQFLGIAGAGRGVRTGNRVEGTLSGEFSIYEAGGATYRAPGTILVRSCRRLTDSPVQTSETHSFVLERTD